MFTLHPRVFLFFFLAEGSRRVSGGQHWRSQIAGPCTCTAGSQIASGWNPETNEGRERERERRRDTRREREEKRRNTETREREREREREKEGRGGRSKSGWLDIQVGKLPKREWKKGAFFRALLFTFSVFFSYKTLYIFEKELLPLEEIWTTLF